MGILVVKWKKMKCNLSIEINLEMFYIWEPSLFSPAVSKTRPVLAIDSQLFRAMQPFNIKSFPVCPHCET